ncbi:MAG: SLC13 family permease [Candidatus Handelsmanbacteria bacterium]|nr:SLC13 family permease [Candidatus Handelsmanbacteria bacterium]
MGGEAWFTLGLLGLMLGLLAFTRLSVDLVMVGTLVALLVSRVLTPEQALAGLANEGMVTVGVLFAVVAGLKETGGIAVLAQRVLGRPLTIVQAQVRLMLPAAAISAFVNNTPIVAMLLPVVVEWAKKHQLSVSRLLIPLSFATVLGGLCTLVGTSTNLVVSGLLAKTTGEQLGLFAPAWVGVPTALAGLLYMLAVGRWLLPERQPPLKRLEDPRQYTVEMLVAPDSPLVGRTIEEAGLRHLQGMYLMEIDRGDEVLAAVSSQERLRANDRLVFVGIVESVVELHKIRGLAPATDQVFKLDAPRANRSLIEAVVSDSCPLVGRSIREGRFRAVYHAAVVAVARNGEQLRQKIGDIVLRPGDTLLLEAHPSFVDQQRNSRDFFLVSRLEDSSPPRHERTWIALGILAAMIGAASLELMSMLSAAVLAAGTMILTRCCSRLQAYRAIDWEVLVVIAASFGLGKALEVSGAAAHIAGALAAIAGGDPWTSLVLIYLMALVFTEVLTNNAAAVLVFPIAMATASSLHVSHMPYIMALMMAASAAFATPIGYTTNLMIYGPGGYRFTDFSRIGLPLNIVAGVVTVLLAPLVWPF